MSSPKLFCVNINKLIKLLWSTLIGNLMAFIYLGIWVYAEDIFLTITTFFIFIILLKYLDKTFIYINKEHPNSFNVRPNCCVHSLPQCGATSSRKFLFLSCAFFETLCLQCIMLTHRTSREGGGRREVHIFLSQTSLPQLLLHSKVLLYIPPLHLRHPKWQP